MSSFIYLFYKFSKVNWNKPLPVQIIHNPFTYSLSISFWQRSRRRSGRGSRSSLSRLAASQTGMSAGRNLMEWKSHRGEVPERLEPSWVPGAQRSVLSLTSCSIDIGHISTTNNATFPESGWGVRHWCIYVYMSKRRWCSLIKIMYSLLSTKSCGRS